MLRMLAKNVNLFVMSSVTSCNKAQSVIQFICLGTAQFKKGSPTHIRQWCDTTS